MVKIFASPPCLLFACTRFHFIFMVSFSDKAIVRGKYRWTTCRCKTVKPAWRWRRGVNPFAVAVISHNGPNRGRRVLLALKTPRQLDDSEGHDKVLNITAQLPFHVSFTINLTVTRVRLTYETLIEKLTRKTSRKKMFFLSNKVEIMSAHYRIYHSCCSYTLIF